MSHGTDAHSGPKKKNIKPWKAMESHSQLPHSFRCIKSARYQATTFFVVHPIWTNHIKSSKSSGKPTVNPTSSRTPAIFKVETAERSMLSSYTRVWGSQNPMPFIISRALTSLIKMRNDQFPTLWLCTFNGLLIIRPIVFH